MVASNTFPEKKVFQMSKRNSAAGPPHRTLLGEVNAHLTCYICRGYYIDATTIVECLHSFCRSCIIQHLQARSYCPVCEMMINSAKPNIKPDKALQDIVYKLVPGLFQKEMERRRSFYSSRPGPAATATPEQRGEDTERIIFSPEDVISFSLEHADATDSDSISSKSSDGNEQQPPADCRRRFLQCPAVVNISHLKKFLCMKFDIDSSQYSLDILYKRIPLPEYYTLMDIAYIYNWKRNKPLRFVYQVIDYLALRNRYSLFDIKKKRSKNQDKSTVDDIPPDSPSLLAQEHEVETAPVISIPITGDTKPKTEVGENSVNVEQSINNSNSEDVEKSQFLNSFELTAKNNCSPEKSPTKSENCDELKKELNEMSPNKTNLSKVEKYLLKRKNTTASSSPDNKKTKTEPETISPQMEMKKSNDINNSDKKSSKDTVPLTVPPNTSSMSSPKEDFKKTTPKPIQEDNQIIPTKRPVPGAQKLSDNNKPNQTTEKKMVSPLKIQLPKPDITPSVSKPADLPKPTVKKMPELKLGFSPRNQPKGPPKMRTDLLANNCDPTKDRSKILPHMKSPLPIQSSSPTSGDPLKSLFDSCKINIPSSLSITLTDQKQELRTPEIVPGDTAAPLNKNVLANVNMHKAPSPPVHNYIEILKLPETEVVQPKSSEAKITNPIKKDLVAPIKSNIPNKPPDTPSAKGPIPSLKPIGEAKLSKQNSNFPVTSPYQQKYIQSLEQSKVSRINVPKVRMQVPNLMPANVKQLTVANKESLKTANESKIPPRSDALDLSTSHNFLLQQSQLGLQEAKTLATMQAIANIANKHTTKDLHLSPMQQHAHYSGIPSTVKSTEPPQLKIPNMNQIKSDKIKILNPMPRHDILKSAPRQPNLPSHSLASPLFQNPHTSPSMASPRQARSPSSSPKLVIAEDKHSGLSDNVNINQSNLISSTQSNLAKSEPPRLLPGPSKIALKSMKPIPTSRHTAPNITNNPMLNPNSEIILQPPIHPQIMLRHLEWLKTQQARQQYENLIKSMPNLKQNHDFNKDKP